mgnify:CR=1 FL=1
MQQGTILKGVGGYYTVLYETDKQCVLKPGGKFRLQDLLIDYDTRQVFVGKDEIDLTQTEYNIMAYLSIHAGKVLTYAAIIRTVWGYSDYGSVKKLQVNMKNIRKKMGVTPGEKRYIINELGVGYRMLEDDK